MRKIRKMTIKMAYEVIILGHLHMPLYFLGTFTEYPYDSIPHKKSPPIKDDGQEPNVFTTE